MTTSLKIADTFLTSRIHTFQRRHLLYVITLCNKPSFVLTSKSTKNPRNYAPVFPVQPQPLSVLHRSEPRPCRSAARRGGPAGADTYPAAHHPCPTGRRLPTARRCRRRPDGSIIPALPPSGGGGGGGGGASSAAWNAERGGRVPLRQRENGGAREAAQSEVVRCRLGCRSALSGLERVGRGARWTEARIPLRACVVCGRPREAGAGCRVRLITGA